MNFLAEDYRGLATLIRSRATASSSHKTLQAILSNNLNVVLSALDAAAAKPATAVDKTREVTVHHHRIAGKETTTFQGDGATYRVDDGRLQIIGIEKNGHVASAVFAPGVWLFVQSAAATPQ